MPMLTKNDLKTVADSHSTVEAAKDALEQLQADLQDKIESKSDNWRDSDKGEHAADMLGQLEEATGNLETALEALSTLQSMAEQVP